MQRWADEEFEPLPMARRQPFAEVDDDDEEQLARQVGALTVSDSKESSEEGSTDDMGSEEDEEEILVLPEHACRYCNLHDPASVARCNSCNKWFCNHISSPTGGAHIVQHLVKARHKEIALHPESPVGDAILECYNCGCRNIFLLGYIPAKADAVVVLLCRSPCAASGGAAGESWDLERWEPLINNRALLPWLVKIPDETALGRAKRVSTNQIHRLEEAWRNRPELTLEDLEKGGAAAAAEGEAEVIPVQLKYANAFEYQSIMAPLVGLEAEYDRQLKEGQRIEGVAVRWECQSLAGGPTRYLAFFCLPRSSEEYRITLGDELILRPQTRSTVTAKGVVVRNNSGSSGLLGSEGLCVEVRQVPKGLGVEEQGGRYSVEFVWKPVSYDRMQHALRTLALDEASVAPAIFQGLMGIEEAEHVTHNMNIRIPDRVSAPGLPELNHSQAHAVRSVLGRPLSLIQGPPGTGKTVTSATIVYHLASAQQGPILVTAPSNVAVDHLTEKIHQTGLRVVRLAAKWREDVDTAVSFLSLHEQARNLGEGRPELQRLLRLRDQTGDLSRADADKLLKHMRAIEQEILKGAQVICCTCVGAGDPRLKGLKFRAVLLDEATQAVEPEALIPVVHGAKQLVLIGDHRQLGPIVMNKQAARAGFNQSLFERLILLGCRPIRLQVQYRMHPCLSTFPSNAFYDGSLQNGVTAGERSRKALDFPWPDPSSPMLFLVCSSPEEMGSSGTSYLNRLEATQCERIVTRFLRAGILPSQIGVITPYDGQRAFIQQHMQLTGALRKDLYAEVEVASVDAFQGREKDYIILSCVRSNDHQGIGFLSDARRLNVALTRARYGLVVLGNARVLARHPLWYHFIMNFKEKGLLMEGSLTAMRQSLLQLLKPRAIHHDQSSRLRSAFPMTAGSQQSQPLPLGTGIRPEDLFRSPFEMPFLSSLSQAGHPTTSFAVLTQQQDDDDDDYDIISQY